MHNAGRKPVLTLEQYPYFRFPETWEIAIISAHPYAEVRFLARLRESDKLGVSVYLDTSDSLGSVGKPYWEIYPNVEGETSRFFLHETDEMLSAITKALQAGANI